MGSTLERGASLKPFFRKTQRENLEKTKKKECMTQEVKAEIYNKEAQSDLCMQVKPDCSGCSSESFVVGTMLPEKLIYLLYNSLP